ncbi:hypothetical protein BKA62DRAFT_714894 [Auriculariales sp. MPI-PUGE-AT-0066]|nr:hypothetical protein BKA62DRAFT_714894 [Auriculariales sp. MPI-PUGE-AT-0066]
MFKRRMPRLVLLRWRSNHNPRMSSAKATALEAERPSPRNRMYISNWTSAILAVLPNLPDIHGGDDKLHQILQRWHMDVHLAYDHDPQRHYHAVSHLTAMWAAYADWIAAGITRLNARDELILFCAVLFHDFVYDPRATGGQNERDSAKRWLDCAAEIQLPADIVEDVNSLILATIKHQLPDDGNPNPNSLPLFLDLDLEVLSRPREDYFVYASQIRAEYAHVPDDAFRVGRCAVLRHLMQGDIYFTEYARTSLQESARANMQAELEQLTNAVGSDS